MIKGYDYKLAEKHLRKKGYKYVTLRELKFKLRYHHADCRFRDKDGNIWAWIKDGNLFISSGYAWNGCSPKVYLANFLLGTPDFHETIEASLIHDVLFQFSSTKHFTHSFEKCNLEFVASMRSYDFVLASLYYHAVEALGRKHFKKDEGAYSESL